jgi:predicted N-acetyltransferase YhbS
MQLRKAKQDELDSIFLMGFDVWADGQNQPTYLEGCRSSKKYASGQWFVLAEDENLFSSLILYEIAPNIFGMGSIATPPTLRGQDFATRLIKEVLDRLERDLIQPIVFLYSDVNPKFYERFGFKALPETYQKHSGSVCMVKPAESIFQIEASTLKVPKYF